MEFLNKQFENNSKKKSLIVEKIRRKKGGDGKFSEYDRNGEVRKVFKEKLSETVFSKCFNL